MRLNLRLRFVRPPRELVLGVLGLLLVACTDPHRVTSPTARPARLQVAASATLAADATVEVQVSYQRRDGSQVELGRQVATLTPGASGGAGNRSLSLVLDIGPCLTDPERAGGTGAEGCPATVAMRLLRGLTVLDEVERTVTLVPGEVATLGDDIALQEVASLSVRLGEGTAPPGMPTDFEAGQRLTATATALDRTGTPIPDRMVTWSTSSANILRLGATSGTSITIDLDAPGRAELLASSGGRQLQTTVIVAAARPRTVLLGPADSTVFVGDTVRYVALARSASGMPVPGAQFQYGASPATVATVTPQGIAIARGPGAASIIATTSGPGGAPVQGQATLRVLTRPVLLVSPTELVLVTGAGSQTPSRRVELTTSGLPIGILSAEVLGGVPVIATINGVVTPSTITVAATRTLAVGDTIRGTVRVRSSSPGVLPVDIGVTVVGQGPAPIVLAPSAVLFGTVDSGAVVAPVSVAITTAAGRTLTDLAASVSYDAGPSAGWLSATIQGSGTNATLNVQPRMQGLGAGTYVATINVSAAGATTVPLSVRLIVRGAAELQAAPAAVDFGTLDSGAVSPAIDVAVTARDGQVATGLTAATAYDGTTSIQWLTAALTGASTGPGIGATLRLTARTLGLRPGSYRATVTVSAASPPAARPVQIPVTVTVRASDSLVVTPVVIDFGTLQPGETPPARTFTVSTVQGRTVELSPQLVAQFTPATPTSWLSRGFAGALTTSATGTVGVATQGLPLGVYSAAVTVRAVDPGVRPTSFRVTMTIAGPTWSQVAAGSGHSCARTTVGEVFCWGRNQSGQLGNNSTTASETPVRVASTLHFTEVSVGAFHSCARTSEGQVHCWGDNFDGQLGTSSNITESRVPVRATSTASFTSVSAGRYHSCGRTTVGDVYCWGYNGSGQVGNGTSMETIRTPVRVAGTASFTSVSAGTFHSCGRTSAGAIHCWGSNEDGQLGNDSTSGSSIPVRVSSALNFTAVSAGAAHSCGRTASGEVHCWGDNFYGQLGNNSTGTRFGTPVRVASTLTFASVSVGASHSCARTATGQVYCWGNNVYGQLGDNSTVTRSLVPVRVISPLTFVDLSTGGDYACALTAAGLLHCWGRTSLDGDEQLSVLGSARRAETGRAARRPAVRR